MSVSRQELIQEAKRRHNPDLDYRRKVVELQAHEMSDTFLARLLAERLESLQEWYAVRLERLKQLGKEKGCWNEMAAIIANGTATAEEPPSYDQLMMRALLKAEALEKALKRIRLGAHPDQSPAEIAADALQKWGTK